MANAGGWEANKWKTRAKKSAPSVVLGVEQEVGADDRDAHGDDGEQQHDEQHEAVDVVDLVGPEGREHKVPGNIFACAAERKATQSKAHLDEDGAEGQHAAGHHDHQRLHEPLLLGDGARDGVDAARVAGLAAQVPAQHRAHQRQRQDDEQADARHRQLQPSLTPVGTQPSRLRSRAFRHTLLYGPTNRTASWGNHTFQVIF